MALQVSFEDDYGHSLPTSYWRVQNVNIRVPGKMIEIIVEGYITANARNNRMPVGTKTFTITNNTQFDNMLSSFRANGVIESVYTYLKTRPFFANSLDV